MGSPDSPIQKKNRQPVAVSHSRFASAGVTSGLEAIGPGGSAHRSCGRVVEDDAAEVVVGAEDVEVGGALDEAVVVLEVVSGGSAASSSPHAATTPSDTTSTATTIARRRMGDILGARGVMDVDRARDA